MRFWKWVPVDFERFCMGVEARIKPEAAHNPGSLLAREETYSHCRHRCACSEGLGSGKILRRQGLGVGVWGLGFGVWGFWVWGFGVLGFWGFGVLGFWGFGVLGFRV